jgi:hypothetical protein
MPTSLLEAQRQLKFLPCSPFFLPLLAELVTSEITSLASVPCIALFKGLSLEQITTLRSIYIYIYSKFSPMHFRFVFCT